MERLSVLVLALLWDLALGEPPNALHPVVFMGRLIAALEARAPRQGTLRQLGYGLLLALMPPLLVAGTGFLALRSAGRAHPLLRLALGSYLLKSSFALRALFAAARRVEHALDAGDLVTARRELRALVSRPTEGLGPELIASAAIESVAENLTDSVVAPLLAFRLAGIPGSLTYRVVNTADAMVGYHSERYEYLGKAAARLDDLANYLPARLAATALVLAAALSRRGWPALHGMLEGRTATASPNAGWTIGAMAGALGVTLEKPGFYRIGKGERPLTAARIGEAIALVAWAAAFIVGSVLFLEARDHGRRSKA
jgi:adenosylcobinamide-phosphate synthase